LDGSHPYSDRTEEVATGIILSRRFSDPDQPAALVLDVPRRQNGLLQMGNGLGPRTFLCALYQGLPDWYGNNEGQLDVTAARADREEE
jgi:hypothetical protein